MRKLVKQLLVDLLGRRDDLFGWRDRQSPISLADCPHILLLQTDGKLGDAIIHSPILTDMKRQNPGIAIDVLTTSGLAKYWGSHPAVSEVHVAPDRGRAAGIRGALVRYRLLVSLRNSYQVAIYLDPFIHLDTFLAARILNAKSSVAFNKYQYRLFDISLSDPIHGPDRQHVAHRRDSLSQAFSLTPSAPPEFHLFYPTEAKERALRIVPASNAPVIFLNVYGSSADKVIRPEYLRDLVDTLCRESSGSPILLNLPFGPERLAYTSALQSSIFRPIFLPSVEIETLFALVSLCDLVITPDTAVAHIAAALEVSLICLYGEGTYSPVVWRPQGRDVVQLVSDTGEVNGIPPERIGQAVRSRNVDVNA